MKKKPLKYKPAETAEPLVVKEAAALPIHEIGAFAAKTHLSEILSKVAQGQSFFITKHGKKIAELKPVTEAAKPKKRNLGNWKGRIWMAPDFDAPLEDFKDYM